MYIKGNLEGLWVQVGNKIWNKVYVEVYDEVRDKVCCNVYDVIWHKVDLVCQTSLEVRYKVENKLKHITV